MRMGSNGCDKLTDSGKADGSETTIEIKLKTMDSQTYTLRVDKQVSVPALKEQIASVTGVLSEQQRLICRGRVLKDDQLLSAYHVEDGHTLHLVARQPLSQGSQGLPIFSEALSGPHNSSEVSPSVVIETYNLPTHGEAVPPEIGRIVSAILGSFGFSSTASGSNEMQGERAASQPRAGSYGIPTTNTSGYVQPPVMPDSLTTLSQYLRQLRTELLGIGLNDANNQNETENTINSDHPSDSQNEQHRFPTTNSLAAVMQSTRQILVEQVGDSLNQLGGLLENQADVTNPSERANNQLNMWRAGVFYHNLGAYFLELGRTTMSARFGQTPNEAVVNAGPAVFISAAGPNPLMVQPLPFQMGSNLGTPPVGATPANPSSGSGMGNTFLPRRIDIQIRRGTSATNPTANPSLHGNDAQHASGQLATTESRDETQAANTHGAGGLFHSDAPSLTGESVRVVPVRTVVAAIPAGLGRSSDSSAGLRTESIRMSRQQQQGFENPARAGGSAGPAANGDYRQPGLSSVYVSNGNNLQSSSIETNQEPERRVNGLLQFLGSLFPGEHIHVEDANLSSRTRSSPLDQERTSGGSSGQNITDEGVFLSTMLRQIIPMINERTGASETASESGIPDDINQASSSRSGRSRQPSDSDASPSCKRQKME